MSCSLHSPSVSVHSGRAGLIFLGSSSSPLSPPFPTLLTGLWDCPQPPRSLQRFGVGTRERASLGAGARSSSHGNLMFVASPSSSPAKVLGGGGGGGGEWFSWFFLWSHVAFGGCVGRLGTLWPSSLWLRGRPPTWHFKRPCSDSGFNFAGDSRLPLAKCHCVHWRT